VTTHEGMADGKDSLTEALLINYLPQHYRVGRMIFFLERARHVFPFQEEGIKYRELRA